MSGGASPRDTKIAALIALARDAARLDRTQSDPLVSLRNAVGVGAPLAIGVLMGSASIGLTSTIGALQTAFADRPGPYRLRIMRMTGTAAAAEVTSGLAVLLSRSAVASAGLLLAIGFVAGLLVSAGPSATQVGTVPSGWRWPGCIGSWPHWRGDHPRRTSGRPWGTGSLSCDGRCTASVTTTVRASRPTGYCWTRPNGSAVS